ncbi:D-amino-acid transaminase [Neobacillus thermocopriae]|uniref:D-alanine aminotransferase n=1 Tax=Neobacillus thermocopriae TaxID=1215031 RepID=A0A6B3TPS9_9BACI|nr:D-amino-acid transaminase [Neobacillus thermocopriae]MED3622789.1 D-amino-acid transaminase [Neobacillus thermocopriae]MED3714225.1 D-amino-acid transaminase [Neobacillus thermocopriae]NEX78632.1 D-amino-acid transaminase [Neobacillus thermocopriae]
MTFAILNGKLIERNQAKMDIEDRGYQFGDGVYEVIRVYNGKMFTLQEHLERFERSTKSIGVSLPYTMDQLKSLLLELVEKNNLRLGIIYMQITRGVAPRNHAFPEENVEPTLVAYTREMPRPKDELQTGVKTILTEDIRWLRCDIKSLNLLGNILAKQKAVEHGCFEAIQHRGQNVTEGSSSNIFMVKNGIVITHESNHMILKGITKDVILGLCSASGIPVNERAFTLKELAEADEVFLSSTVAEVMPIIEVEGKVVGNGEPGPITRKIQELFVNEIEKQCGAL